MIQYQILHYVSIFSLLLPVLAGIYRFKVLGNEVKLLLLYLAIAFNAAITTTWLIKSQWMSLGILHLCVLVEYIVVMIIIISWQEAKNMKRFFLIFFWAYILFWLVAKITFEPFNGGFSITSTVFQVILSLSAGYTLFIVIGNHVQSLLRNQHFWILIAFVFNYLGTLIPIVIADVFFSHDRETLFIFYSINWVLITCSNLFFTTGILCPQTQQ